MNIDADKIAISDIIHSLTSRMITRDIEGLDSILDNDFTLTHITGYVQPKREWLAEISTEKMRYYASEEIELSISVTEDDAVCRFRQLIDAKIWGTRSQWPLQQTINLHRRNGSWTIGRSVARTF